MSFLFNKKPKPNQSLDLSIFKLAVENVSEHIVITDAEGFILFANRAAEKITGFSSKEMIGKKPGALWGGQMSHEFYKELWHTIKIEKKTYQGEINNVKKSGQKYIAHSIITPVLDETGAVKFYVGIERDITEEKQIDQAKTEFVSLASHQLRTPLTAINWYSEYLLNSNDSDSGVRLDKEQTQYIQEIHESAEQMTELVNSLLNVSRIDLGTFDISPEPSNIVQLSQQVLKELQPQITKKSLTIQEEYATNLPQINLDPNLIRIVFQNLLSNAVKYTPEGGLVSLKIEQQKTEIEVKIEDNGYGIPKNQQEKIFHKLFRADNIQKKAIEGTGLGLYIVKAIIEASDGQIHFESTENEGTTFRFTLPLAGVSKNTGKKLLSVMTSSK